MATASHTVSSSDDVNFFTDADLSILGQTWDVYFEYAKDVRKEYAIYPDLIYNHGRKRVLTRFLSMDRIFKTATFSGLYEAAARQNIERELATL